MQAAIDYCTPIYDALTDANAMEMVTPPAAPGHAPGSPQPRAAILIRDLAHNNEESATSSATSAPTTWCHHPLKIKIKAADFAATSA